MEIAVRRGSIQIWTVVVLFVAIMCLSVSMEFMKIFILLTDIADTADEAVIAAASVNVPNIYDGVRESDGSARDYYERHWQRLVTTEQAKLTMISSLKLIQNGEKLERKTEEKIIYSIKNYSVKFINADESTLNFQTEFTVLMPIYFAGNKLCNIEKKITVKSKYEPKF